MRRFLLMMAVTTAMCTQSYAEDNVNLGYTNNESVASSSTFNSFGDNEVSAAIFLPASVLKGYQGNSISSIRAGISSRTNLELLTVWVRKSLNGENLAVGQTDSPSRRWNDVQLDTPYYINGEDGLYIGYTAKHYDDAGIVASNEGNVVANSFFYQARKGEAWQDVFPYGRVALEAVVAGSSLPAQDLQLVAAHAKENEETGKIDVTAIVRNNGTAQADGFKLTWGDAKSNQTGAQNFTEQVGANGGNATVSFSVDVADDVKAILGIDDNLLVSVSPLAGTDAAEGNNTLPALLTFKRKVLIEEYTGESCNNCPQAAETLEKLLSDPVYGSQVATISRHWGYSNDAFTLQGDKDHDRELVWYFAHDGLQGAPAFSFDRFPYFFEESITGSGAILQSAIYIGNDLTVADFQGYINRRLAIPADARLMLNANYDAATRDLKIAVKGYRNGRLSNKPSHLTVVLTENKVRAVKQYYTTTDWFDEYYHQHCYRWYNDLWGEEIQWDGLNFQKELTVKLDNSWKPEDMTVVAYISEYDNESPLNMVVNNAADLAIKQLVPTAIREVSRDGETGQTYNLHGQRVDSQKASGLLIRNGKKFIKH